MSSTRRGFTWIAASVACLFLIGCTADEEAVTGPSTGLEETDEVRAAHHNENFPFTVTPTDTTVLPVMSGGFEGTDTGDDPEVVTLVVQVEDPPFPGVSIEDVAVEFGFERPVGGPDTTTNLTGGHNHPLAGDTLPERPRGRFIASVLSQKYLVVKWAHG